MTRRLPPAEHLVAAWRRDPVYRAAYAATEIVLALIAEHVADADDSFQADRRKGPQPRRRSRRR